MSRCRCFRYPGTPLYAQMFGAPDDQAWERAHDYYRSTFARQGVQRHTGAAAAGARGPGMHALVTADTVGGVWTYTRELVTGLVQRGVRVYAGQLRQTARAAPDAPGWKAWPVWTSVRRGFAWNGCRMRRARPGRSRRYLRRSARGEARHRALEPVLLRRPGAGRAQDRGGAQRRGELVGGGAWPGTAS